MGMYDHLGEHVGASDVCMDCRNALTDVDGWQLCKPCYKIRQANRTGTITLTLTEAEVKALAGDCCTSKNAAIKSFGESLAWAHHIAGPDDKLDFAWASQESSEMLYPEEG